MRDLNFPIILGAWLLSLVIMALIFRAFFDVKKRLWIQQKQLDLMIKMAEKQGVSIDEINEILNK